MAELVKEIAPYAKFSLDRDVKPHEKIIISTHKQLCAVLCNTLDIIEVLLILRKDTVK